MKNRITFCTFWEFLGKKNRVWSKLKKSELKSKIAYHGAINFGILKPRKAWSHNLVPKLDHKRPFKKNLSQSLGAFVSTTPAFLKAIS